MSTNLPPQHTSFVGRETAIATVRAARLFGAAVAAFPTDGDVLEPTAQSLYQPSLAAAHRSAGSAKFDVWFAEGRSAPLAEVIAEALASESLAADDQQKARCGPRCCRLARKRSPR